MVSRLCYLYTGNPHSWKDSLYIEKDLGYNSIISMQFLQGLFEYKDANLLV